MRHYFILVVSFLGFIQCKESENSANLTTSVENSIQHAEGFSIEKYNGFSVVKVSNAYPEAKVWIGALDENLTSKGYITPGLGDAGDRLFGTL